MTTDAGVESGIAVFFLITGENNVNCHGVIVVVHFYSDHPNTVCVWSMQKLEASW